jgi:hypothetical protein
MPYLHPLPAHRLAPTTSHHHAPDHPTSSLPPSPQLHSAADDVFTHLAALQQLTFQAMFIRKVPSSLEDLAGLQRLVLGTAGRLEVQVASQLAARVQLQELEACCSDMRAAVQLLACLERHKVRAWVLGSAAGGWV